MDLVYDTPRRYAGLAVCVAATLYTLQLYADFSGCVDICRGIARMLGIEVIENFRRPLFSQSIAEFWRRWHISLGAFLRDYLYFPLGGSRKGRARKALNTLAVFAVSGLWHGAGLNFLFWGLFNGACIVLGGATIKARDAFWHRIGAKQPPRFLLHGFDGSLPELLDLKDTLVLCLGLGLMLLVSALSERMESGCLRDRIAALRLPLRWALWLALLMTVLVFGVYGPGYDKAQFIYMGF